jgi:spermidine synthase
VEYFQMCREHLNPGGSVCLWIPLYESTLDGARSAIASFFQVFPHGILWSNEHPGYGVDTFWNNGRGGFGYDAILFGQVEPTLIDVDALERRLDRPEYHRVKQSLYDVGFGSFDALSGDGVVRRVGIDLLATYAGQAPLLAEWTRGAQINTDRSLRLQYLSGMGLNSHMGGQILAGILAHYRFPDQTFVGSPEALRALKQALGQAGRKRSAGVVRSQSRGGAER